MVVANDFLVNIFHKPQPEIVWFFFHHLLQCMDELQKISEINQQQKL